VWACEKCIYIHKREIADLIFSLKDQDYGQEEIYDVLIGRKQNEQD